MDLLVQKNTIKLLRQIADNKNVISPIITFNPQKPAFDKTILSEQPFPRKSPESVGISSGHIYDFISELQGEGSLNMHSVLILRNGMLISEASFGAYKTDVWHITHSMCKSITGLAIGMLIDDGLISLDTPVMGIFEKKGLNLNAFLHRNLLVRHLLSMSSGILFNEAGSVTDEDWVKSYLESTPRFEPGTQFAYNSMNSYMLSAIVKQITGKNLTEFLKDRLFDPLGIKNVYWETCPKGIEKGGWGLYILPIDAAKIGQLVLQKGVWNGKRLISEEWIDLSCEAKMKTSGSLGAFDYGYHIWSGKNQRMFLFNGMFGQNVVGYPDTGILIVSSAGNDEMFQQSAFFPLLDKYFGKDFAPPDRLPRNSAAEKRLRRLESSWGRPQIPLFARLFKNASSLPKQCSLVSGKTFYTDGNIKTAGLFPLMAQVLQNNYSTGLKGISFSSSGGSFIIHIIENDLSFDIPVGFTEAKYTDIDIHGEPYIVGTLGNFGTDDDGNLVFRARFSFLELSNSRTMKCTFLKDKIKIQFSERPGPLQIKMFLGSLDTMSRLFRSMFSKLDPDFFEYKLERIFDPVLFGVERDESKAE